MAKDSGIHQTLGPLQAYAALIGILVGAGIFKVSDAYPITGPSVVLGYVILAPMVLAAALPYAAFQSTSLVHSTGGDFAHIRAVFGPGVLSFLAGWLKLISYLGALAYLASALEQYLLALLGVDVAPGWVATFVLIGFFLIHAAGVTWFGRAQVVMCTVLGASILVLVIPGLFAIQAENFTPFLKGGSGGLISSLPVLFFAYAGFESIAHNAADVRDGRSTLPKVYLRGVGITMLIFISMSAVVVGVLDEKTMLASAAPMAVAAEQFLPFGAAAIVTLGGVMATATSVNATIAVPPRLAATIAEDGHLPEALTRMPARTRVPLLGLALSFVVTESLLLSGQFGVALRMAVLALISVYALHSLAYLFVWRRAPAIAAEIGLGWSPTVQRGAAFVALVSLGTLIVGIFEADLAKIQDAGRYESLSTLYEGLTSIELIVLWALLGLALRAVARRSRASG